MCGITAYVGNINAVRTAIECLKRLEYRGYDSAGVACIDAGSLHVVRASGKIASLESAVEEAPCQDALRNSTVAIAHTRWATHGEPSVRNAHPHRDCTGKVAVVHNGIIENYAELRDRLVADGHEFASETDTEVIAHLIEDACSLRDIYKAECSSHSVDHYANAIRSALHLLEGSFAVAIVIDFCPGVVFAARRDSPLIIGVGDEARCLASDISALPSNINRMIVLEDGDFAQIERTSVRLTDVSGELVSRPVVIAEHLEVINDKGKCAHYMLKEIREQKAIVTRTIEGRLIGKHRVELPTISSRLDSTQWSSIHRIIIVGCGTAYHAGVYGKRLIEQTLRVPVDAVTASEFRYGEPIVNAHTLVIGISQSGETADTIAAIKEANELGGLTIAIVNVHGSALARSADAVLLTHAGVEIGVASTKAYTAQLTTIALLTAYLGCLSPESTPVENLIADIARLPELIARSLTLENEISELITRFDDISTYFFVGRGYDYAASMEAALKLKEISYMHAEAYAAGEMKHGPLALITRQTATIGLCTQSATVAKLIGNLQEVKARNGIVAAFTREDLILPQGCRDVTVALPAAHDALMPIVAAPAMQLLAYYVALRRGCEIDQPRNLAKSVTVE